MFHKWNNLKNNRKNREMIENDMFEDNCFDEAIAAFLLGILFAIILSLFLGVEYV